MLTMGQGTDDHILVTFQITVLGLSHSTWGNERLSKGLRSLSAFLVPTFPEFLICFVFTALLSN